jgi:hypothetical protein
MIRLYNVWNSFAIYCNAGLYDYLSPYVIQLFAILEDTVHWNFNFTIWYWYRNIYMYSWKND